MPATYLSKLQDPMKAKKQLDKAVKILTDLPAIKHEKPKYPTNEELNKKFVMRIKNGKPTMIEVS